jgi:hypothetical protein
MEQGLNAEQMAARQHTSPANVRKLVSSINT